MKKFLPKFLPVVTLCVQFYFCYRENGLVTTLTVLAITAAILAVVYRQRIKEYFNSLKSGAL